MNAIALISSYRLTFSFLPLSLSLSLEDVPLRNLDRGVFWITKSSILPHGLSKSLYNRDYTICEVERLSACPMPITAVALNTEYVFSLTSPIQLGLEGREIHSNVKLDYSLKDYCRQSWLFENGATFLFSVKYLLVLSCVHFQQFSNPCTFMLFKVFPLFFWSFHFHYSLCPRIWYTFDFFSCPEIWYTYRVPAL